MEISASRARAQALDHRDDAAQAPRRPARSRRRGASTRRRCRGCRRPPRRAAAPCSIAACVDACRPPSEKLSGVTLTMPMMRGRSSARPARRARGAVIASSQRGRLQACRGPSRARRRRRARAMRRLMRAPSRSTISTAAKRSGWPASGSPLQASSSPASAGAGKDADGPDVDRALHGRRGSRKRNGRGMARGRI